MSLNCGRVRQSDTPHTRILSRKAAVGLCPHLCRRCVGRRRHRILRSQHAIFPAGRRCCFARKCGRLCGCCFVVLMEPVGVERFTCVLDVGRGFLCRSHLVPVCKTLKGRVCVCVCVCARARVCVYVCVCNPSLRRDHHEDNSVQQNDMRRYGESLPRTIQTE